MLCHCGRTFDPRWPGNATARICPGCAERRGIEPDPEARRELERDVLADPFTRRLLASIRAKQPAVALPHDNEAA